LNKKSLTKKNVFKKIMLTTSFLYFMIIITLLSLLQPWLQRTTNKQEGHTLITKIPNYITIFIYIYKKKERSDPSAFQWED